MHLGRNITQIREALGIKQKTLATKLGKSQQTVSRIEQSKYLTDEILKLVGEVLGVSVQAIKTFNKEKLLMYFNNNQNSNHQLRINLLERVVEVCEDLLKMEKQKTPN